MKVNNIREYILYIVIYNNKYVFVFIPVPDKISKGSMQTYVASGTQLHKI